jgi:hypothetical protein
MPNTPKIASLEPSPIAATPVPRAIAEYRHADTKNSAAHQVSPNGRVFDVEGLDSAHTKQHINSRAADHDGCQHDFQNCEVAQQELIDARVTPSDTI